MAIVGGGSGAFFTRWNRRIWFRLQSISKLRAYSSVSSTNMIVGTHCRPQRTPSKILYFPLCHTMMALMGWGFGRMMIFDLCTLLLIKCCAKSHTFAHYRSLELDQKEIMSGMSGSMQRSARSVRL